jgi:hypothetical protein
MDEIHTSFGHLRVNISAKLKVTMFSLSHMHQAPRQVKYIKYYQIYSSKSRRNTGVGVLIDQVLTTYTHECTLNGMYICFMRGGICTYILYLETGIFQSIVGVQD